MAFATLPAPRHASFLLLGGGLASATGAETLRQEGAQGAIVIVADERDPPACAGALASLCWRASGSLPPGFPWTTIDGKHYWDGGIISNSPLELLLERTGTARKRVFIVDLYPDTGALPANLMEVLGRRDEIVFAERIRRDSAAQSLAGDFRKLVDSILAHASSPAQAERVRQWPNYIQLMADRDAGPTITRILRQGSGCETAARDYDFSATSIARHVGQGSAAGRAALAGACGAKPQPWQGC